MPIVSERLARLELRFLYTYITRTYLKLNDPFKTGASAYI